ncbi:Gp138 family membrane-puncturing spike protein [Paraburkholderia sediminicola]|uniref:Gp138 family membrane-puncturing spike protein n=1 Tax=Paraburkholderia sediminicola TaxID=458836 RepID=UPI0038B86DDE
MLQLERVNDAQEALRQVLGGHQAQVWTALPGIIESFNAGAVTCVVQPSIKAQVRASDGSMQWVALPLLLDCPVVFPRGGGCTLTFPIAQDDECLVVFASRCIDAWYSAGGVQVQSEFRMHDLSDGFALPGPFSQATKIGSISTNSVQLRSNDATTYIDLNPTSQKVKIVAPGGFEVDAPTNLFTGAVTIRGLLTWLAGMAGSTASGVAATITGVINFFGSLTSNSKSIDSTHTHTAQGATAITTPPD